MKRILIAVALVLGFAGAARAEEDGAALYKAKCAACHGANGEGAKMAPAGIAGMTTDQVQKAITEGKGKMKPMKNVSEAEAAAIAKHVGGLKKQ